MQFSKCQPSVSWNGRDWDPTYMTNLAQIFSITGGGGGLWFRSDLMAAPLISGTELQTKNPRLDLGVQLDLIRFPWRIFDFSSDLKKTSGEEVKCLQGN